MPDSQSQPFSDLQTAIPTPYTSEATGAPHAPREAYTGGDYVQALMFAAPTTLRGQLHMDTDTARDV